MSSSSSCQRVTENAAKDRVTTPNTDSREVGDYSTAQDRTIDYDSMKVESVLGECPVNDTGSVDDNDPKVLVQWSDTSGANPQSMQWLRRSKARMLLGGPSALARYYCLRYGGRLDKPEDAVVDESKLEEWEKQASSCISASKQACNRTYYQVVSDANRCTGQIGGMDTGLANADYHATRDVDRIIRRARYAAACDRPRPLTIPQERQYLMELGLASAPGPLFGGLYDTEAFVSRK